MRSLAGVGHTEYEAITHDVLVDELLGADTIRVFEVAFSLEPDVWESAFAP